MPTSPGTPRRTSKNRRSAPVTPALRDATSPKPVGSVDLTSVQERVRRWQQQGSVGLAPPLSSTPPPDDENADAQEPKVAKPEQKTPKKTRRTSGLVDPANKEWVRRPRSSSTPRKRVVSDEHWKSKLNNKSKRSPRSGLSGNQPVEPRQSLVGLDGTADRPARSRRSDRQENRVSSPIFQLSQKQRAHTDHNVTPRSSRILDYNRVELSLGNVESEGDNDTLPRRQSKTPHSATLRQRRETDQSSVTAEEAPARQSQYAATLNRPPIDLESSLGTKTLSIRSRKTGLINHAKDLFSSRNGPPQPTSNRAPSIEAWLADQPDPFIDNEVPSVEVPAPLKPSSNRSKSDVFPLPVEDPNKIWDLVEAEETTMDLGATSRPPSRRKPRTSKEAKESKSIGPGAFEVVQTAERTEILSPQSPQVSQALDEDSPSGLRRRGAKSSRRKFGPAPTSPISSQVETTPKEDSQPAKDLAKPEPLAIKGRTTKKYRTDTSTGSHRLSPIQSVETFEVGGHAAGYQIELGEAQDKATKGSTATPLDVESLLSMSKTAGSIVSSRSLRNSRRRAATATLGEALEQLATDEAKYMRELVTLVDGVIPVLLQCVLSKSDNATAAGLFSSSGCDDSDFTQPIVDMGIALERLKTLHKRIPTHDLNALLPWAQSARRIYLEYVEAWRLGFQDVIVNLAPLTERSQDEMDEGLGRDENGDVINSHGQKVDVAYLLKRPLVRIKNLTKLFARFASLKPSLRSKTLADEYTDLLNTTRRRSDEEHSRLQDQEAAGINATKTRDLSTLAALPGVQIDENKRVKAAKDHFNLTLYHSSGQRLDCLVELILRGDGGDTNTKGDLLICEVDKDERWLLFPPLGLDEVSARPGEDASEAVVLVRGIDCVPQWQEVLLLQSNDTKAISEWIQMLGTSPQPPMLNRSLSFINKPDVVPISVERDLRSDQRPLPSIPTPLETDEIQIPIGEPSVIGSSNRQQPRSTQALRPSDQYITTPVDESSIRPSILASKKNASESPARFDSPLRQAQSALPNESPNETPRSTLQKTRAINKRPGEIDTRVYSSPLVPTSVSSPSQPTREIVVRKLSRTDAASREWMSSPVSDPVTTPVQGRRDDDFYDRPKAPERPEFERAVASAPSSELPTVPRLRTDKQETKARVGLIREQWSALTGGVKAPRHPTSPAKVDPIRRDTEPQSSPSEDLLKEIVPAPPKHRSQSLVSTPSKAKDEQLGSQSVGISSRRRPETAPHLPSTLSQPKSDSKRDTGGRRSSSPLKREYAPSTDSDSDESDEESIASSSSETSADATYHVDRSLPIPSRRDGRQIGKPQISAPVATATISAPASTLAPSNSASQGPYRTVPPLASQPSAFKYKRIAAVAVWSDTAAWQYLSAKDLCSIVVTPGLIEVYKMSAAHSDPELDGNTSAQPPQEGDQVNVRPLLAFEVTPLVPLHLGTGLDINVRSPPTPRSECQVHSTFMFRSRSPAECGDLYHLMNTARMNNPTWEALVAARPGSKAADAMFDGGRGSARHSRMGSRAGSFFKFGRRSSYRAPSHPSGKAQSIAGASESSVGSLSSAISALRRFSGGSRFNINRSSVLRREGQLGPTAAASLYTSSSGTTGTGFHSGATSPEPSQVALSSSANQSGSGPSAPRGIVNDIKIHLYVRNLPDWNLKGSGLLTIMPATMALLNGNTNSTVMLPDFDPSPPGTASGSRATSTLTGAQPSQSREPRLPSSYHTPHRVHGNGQEKRVVIMGKTKRETMLDVTLHESCFERVGRKGIAMGVWEEHTEIARTGGVVGGSNTTYLIQMKTEAEAAWVFNQVGRLRY